MGIEENGNVTSVKRSDKEKGQMLDAQMTSSAIQASDQAGQSTQQVEQSNLSPTTIDQTRQAQGQELQEVLRLFRQTTTEPISSFFLPTPQHKIALDHEPLQNQIKIYPSQGKVQG
jgi:hypothetical protein